jgi:hypothetical protein
MRAQIILLALILFASTAFAAPAINNVVANPYVWLGENEQIVLTCSDASYNITSVYADIAGPNITLPRLYFTGTNNYTLTIDKLYLDRIGTFNSLITCINDNNETATQSLPIDVYELTGSINNITPENIYTDDIVEIDYSLRKNNAEITSSASFSIKINGNSVPLKVAPAYDVNKGWILIIDPLQVGEYTLNIDASYDRVSVETDRQINVGYGIYFSIETIDNTNLLENMNVSVLLSASERGTTIEITKDNLDIEIGSRSVEITEIVKNGENFVAKINAPAFSYGTYPLKAYLTHPRGTFTSTRDVVYRMPVSGKVIDGNNKPTNTLIQFFSGAIEKLKLQTDGSGSYSGYILPGTYKMQLTFPQSIVYLTDVNVNSFSDPLRYGYLTGVKIPGISATGVYVYEFGLTFNKADIELGYNEKELESEDDIKILKCSSWNYGSNSCRDNWTEISGITDKVRNVVKLNVTKLSAFAVGTKDKIRVQYNFDKSLFYLRDVVRIHGIVTDINNEPIEGVSISLYNNNAEINHTATSDVGGVFLFEFLTPNTEGNYTLLLSAKKTPFINASDVLKIEVVKNTDLTILLKDTFQLMGGESSEEEIRIANTGQTDITNISFIVEGVQEYCVLSANYTESIPVGQEKVIKLNFYVPANSSEGTFSGTIRVVSDQITKEKVFGFTVLPVTQNNSTVTTTGYSIGLPEINLDANIYILLFAIACFALAYKMKKRKNKNSVNYANTLSEIKLQMSREAAAIKGIGENGKNN